MNSQHQRDSKHCTGKPSPERLNEPLGPILGAHRSYSDITTADYLQLLTSRSDAIWTWHLSKDH